MQYQCRLIVGWQALDKSLDTGRHLRLSSLLLRRGGRFIGPLSIGFCFFKGEGDFGLLGRPSPKVIQVDVGGDPVKPSRQAGLAAKSWQAPMNPDKRFLSQVFGLGLVLSHPQQVVVDGPFIFDKDSGKVRGLAFLTLLRL